MHDIRNEPHGRAELRSNHPTAETLLVELSGSWRLQEFSGAARSVRVLADYLKRNPDSVLYGKTGSWR